MRVVCPNCGAEYELDSALVPPGGRDLQCSECDHAWFERRPGAPTQTPKPTPAPTPKPATEARTVRRPRDDTARKVETPAPAPFPQPEDNEEPETAKPARRDSGRAEPTPRPLDSDTRRILHEEAARERDRRRGTGAAREDTPPRRPDARSDPPRRNAAPQEETGTSTPRPGASVPDARTIRSTDVSHRSDGPDKPVTPPSRKSGLATGFLTVLAIVAVLVLLYLGADLVAGRLPAIAPELASYTAAIDTIMARAGSLIQGILGGAG